MSTAHLPLVVVADPDPLSQRQLVQLLQPSFRCVVTSTLRETYHVLRQERPALLVLDVDQPDGDGLALIRPVFEHPAYNSILIACVTRRATVRDKIAAFRAGADDYLIKPLSPNANFLGRMLLLLRAGYTARAAR